MQEAVAGLIGKAAGAIPLEDGDYYLDGLLYCGKCQTPKEKSMVFPWGPMIVRCLCRCRSEAYNREREDDAAKQRKIQAEINRSLFPDQAMQTWTFARDDRKNPALSDACWNYCLHFPEMRKNGKGLLFFGPVGTGKTFFATAIANELIDEGYRCFVTNFPRLCNRLSALRDRQAGIDDLNSYDLLVIDDLASERNTEFMNELVWNVIDSRYRAGLPIIITTNLTREELKTTEIAQARIFSRLYEMCTFLRVDGADRRIGAMKKNHTEMMGLLGL